jgi:prolyl oligopeptidase
VWADAPGTPPPTTVVATQETLRSSDGTEVRLTVLAPSGKPDRPRPTVLYGYGGFGIALEPGYTTSALAWLAAGGVWAIAHLRGGAEEGEAWHRAGMRERKQNVFDDLHAAAQHLRDSGRADRLGIYGGSNGGLLVGAALTQRPELYDAVVCSAPLLDMVRYELFGLGRTWNDEFGTAEDPIEFGWLLGYSPYHAVREGVAYPAVLFEVFDSDTRVDPLHARKMCAALQAAARPDGPPILLRRETDVGHAARSVDRTVALTVDTLSFLAHHLGLDLTALGNEPGDAMPSMTPELRSTA